MRGFISQNRGASSHLYNSVEWNTVVITSLCKLNEVFACTRSVIPVQLEVDIAHAGLQADSFVLPSRHFAKKADVQSERNGLGQSAKVREQAGSDRCHLFYAIWHTGLTATL